MAASSGESDPPTRPTLRPRGRFTYRRVDVESVAKPNVPAANRTPEKRLTPLVRKIIADRSMRTLIVEYEHKVRQVISNLRMEEHTDDILQDFYVFVSRKNAKGQNGLEAYDPTVAAFSTYIYKAAVLMTLNYRAKLDRDRLQLSPKGIDPEMGKQVEHRPNRMQFWLQLERIADAFDDQATDDDGFFDDDGRFITRDLKTILGLLLEGLTRLELARKLRCAPAEIDGLLDVLRGCEELQVLLQDKGEE